MLSSESLASKEGFGIALLEGYTVQLMDWFIKEELHSFVVKKEVWFIKEELLHSFVVKKGGMVIKEEVHS